MATGPKVKSRNVLYAASWMMFSNNAVPWPGLTNEHLVLLDGAGQNPTLEAPIQTRLRNPRFGTRR